MQWINAEQATFYGAVWSVAFIAAVFVHMGGSGRKHQRNCFWVGGIAGFLAFASVAVLVGRSPERLSGEWYYLGLSAIIGLSSKQAEQLRKKLFDFALAQKINWNVGKDKEPDE